MNSIDPDLIELLGPGTSIIVATAGPDCEPRATRGWTVRVVDADEARVRVLMSADDVVSVGNLQSGAIAVTGCHVRTLRSAQIKGRVVCVEPPTAADLADLEHDSDLFFAEVNATDGNPVELLRRLLPCEAIAVEFVVDEQYDQSPGPNAGARVDRAIGSTS